MTRFWLTLFALAISAQSVTAQVVGQGEAAPTTNSAAWPIKVIFGDAHIDPREPMADVTASGAIDADEEAVSLAIQGRQSVGVVLSGTWTATLRLEVSGDGGSTWVTTNFTYPGIGPLTNEITESGSWNGYYGALLSSGATHVRVRADDHTSGTVNVALRGVSSPSFEDRSVYFGTDAAFTVVGGIDGATNPQHVTMSNTTPSSSDMAFVVRDASLTDLTATGTLNVLNETVTLALEGRQSVGVASVSSSFVGTIIAEATANGSNWNPVDVAYPEGGTLPSVYSGHTQILGLSGMSQVRLRVSTYTSGSMAVTVRATNTAPRGLVTEAATGEPVSNKVLLVGGATEGSSLASQVNVAATTPGASATGFVVREATSADVTASGTLTALDQTVSLAIEGRQTAALALGATAYTGTLVAEASYDGGSTWAGSFFVADGATQNSLGSATNIQREISIPEAATHVRVRASAWTSGTATVALRATSRVPRPPRAIFADGDLSNLSGQMVGFLDPDGETFRLPVATNTAPTSSAYALATREVARGQATMAESIPMTIASDQSPIDVAVVSMTGGGLTDAELRATPVPVSGTVTATATNLDVQIGGSDSLTIGTLPAIPAGTNNIGDVDVLTLPALAAGTNNIGDVDVLTLPAIPAGNNNIGDVDVASIAAGNNNIGDVDVATIAAGNNNIGDVDVASVIPGTGATNLGKAEDAGHTTADSGVAGLAVVRETSATQFADANNDYVNPTADRYGVQSISGRHPNAVRCTITSTATTSTLVTGCSAPGANLSIYITSMQWSSSIISTTANFMRIQSGTGGTCGTSTDVLYDGYALAFTSVTMSFETPIKVQANEEVCFVHASAGTRLVNIQGFIAP